MINQTLALPIANGMGRLYLRVGGPQPTILPVMGPEARLRVGASDDRYVWEGEESGVRHRVTLWLHPRLNAWFWRVEVVNDRERDVSCDAVFIQDLGLGDQGFLMNNEAYASQYIDHHIARHPRLNHVLMSRQNLSQGAAHPWTAHGCLEGAEGFATDFRQVMGPAYRDADQLGVPFGTSLPSVRLQYETACAALQSKAVTLEPGAATSWTFFGFYEPDHPAASSDSDLSQIEIVEDASKDWAPREVALSAPPRSLLHDARSVVAEALDEKAIKARYRRRTHVERVDGQLLSFFVPGRTHSRHVVLRDKERIVARRHGALIRSGQSMLPDETILCATAWMHGVFGAQLTIGNTSFHKLFSVSRDPYNITRASGLRMLMETKGRMAVADCSIRLRDGPQRLPLDLSTRPANRHGLCDGFRRRARHAMARHARRAKTPLSCFWPSCPWRAGIWACRSDRDRTRDESASLSGRISMIAGASSTPRPSIVW